VSPAIRATSEGIISRESARSRAHSRTAVTTETRGDPNILEKLGMRDRVELTRYAIRRGLVQA
jgi:DNA-binding NarL/FixJ family response regulator